MHHHRHFTIGKLGFDPAQPDAQTVLADAYGNKQRAVCHCTSIKPEMYIARIADSFVLKRMPGTGHLHDPDCDSFDPPPELSGRGELGRTAIVTDEAGDTALALDFALSMRSGHTPPESSGASEPASIKAEASKLRLLGLLHYLWDCAELTKWRPSWGGKRSWFVVRREISAVAERTVSKKIPMASRLYVPAMFSPEKKEELALQRRKLLHPLLPVTGKPVPLGIVVGELKSLDPSQYGRKLTVKHAPDFAFFMSEDLCKKFDAHMADKVQMVEAIEGTHLIIIATFSARGSYAEVQEIAVMPVTAQWIPFEHDREFELVSKLANRSFVKCLKYNMPRSAPIANALLTDTPTPTALYCPPPAQSAEENDALAEFAGEGTYPAWLWRSDADEMPALPLPASRQ